MRGFNLTSLIAALEACDSLETKEDGVDRRCLGEFEDIWTDEYSLLEAGVSSLLVLIKISSLITLFDSILAM